MMPSIMGLPTREKHSARNRTTNKPAKHMPLPVSTAKQQLPHQSLHNLTHENESTVEPSIALKYESPSASRKYELLQKLRELTRERESTVKPHIAQNTEHFPEMISQKKSTVSLKTVLLVQTDQDVKHLEYFHHRREHSEQDRHQENQPRTCRCLERQRARPQIGNITVLLFHTGQDTEHLGLTAREGTQREVKNQQ